MAKENDVVLIYLEDNPLSFARIEEISSDVKKDWYLVKLLMLQVPVQVATWILRDISSPLLRYSSASSYLFTLISIVPISLEQLARPCSLPVSRYIESASTQYCKAVS